MRHHVLIVCCHSVIVRLVVPVHAEQIISVVYSESVQRGLFPVFMEDRRLFSFGEDVVFRISTFKIGAWNQFKPYAVFSKMRDFPPCMLKYVLEILEDRQLLLFLQDIVFDLQEFNG